MKKRIVTTLLLFSFGLLITPTHQVISAEILTSEANVLAREFENSLKELNRNDVDILKAKEALQFFDSNGVSKNDIETLIVQDPEMLFNFRNEASVNNFSREQIQEYIDGLIATPTQFVDPNDEQYRVERDDYNNVITVDGEVHPDTTIAKSNSIHQQAADQLIGLDADSLHYVGASWDKTGASYIVKARAGYNTATQAVVLPRIYNYNTLDAPYIMWGVYQSSDGLGGDYGLYFSKYDLQWHGFWSTNGTDNRGTTAGEWMGDPEKYDPTPIPTNATVYMYLYQTADRNVRVRLVNQKNFSQVYYDRTIRTNYPLTNAYADIYKQVTIAQKVCENGNNFNSNTGTRMEGAYIWDTYVYNNTGAYRLDTSRVWQAIARAETLAEAQNTIFLNNYNTKWHSETVNIRLNYNSPF